eukprot:gene6326-7051_t
MATTHKIIVRHAYQIVNVCKNSEMLLRGKEMGHVALTEDKDGLSLIVGKDGLVLDYGTDKEIESKYVNCTFETEINADGQTIMPGLIDGHTHPVWVGDRVHEFAMKLAGATYMDVHKAGGGINFTVEHVRNATEDKLYASLLKRLQRMVRCGTTLVEAKSGYGLEVESEIKMLRVIEKAKKNFKDIEISSTFCGAHSVPRGKTMEEATNDVIDVQIPKIKELMEKKELHVENIDVFCEKGVFDTEATRKILTAGKEAGLALNFHGDELHPMASGELGAELEARAISHLEEVSDAGIKCMSDKSVVAVVLPTTAYILRLSPPPVRKMIEAGVAVALGSDFNPNAFCLSMPMTMHLACVILRMSMNEALVAATINAAASLGRSKTHGSIEIGKIADLLIIDAPRWQLLEKDERTGGTDKANGPTVANVRPGGLADKSDYFCIGERILEINDTDITKLKHAEIIRFVQDSGKRLRFKVAYKNTANENSVCKTTTLKLFKEDCEAKFKLRGGKSKDGLIIRPVTIAEIDQKSELAKSGEILDGDIVLAINDKSVESLHISEIKQLVKQISGEYKMKIQYEVSQPDNEETPRKSIIVELLRPNENVDPGLSLDVSLEHEQLGSIVVISEVKESGIASRTGALNVGDLVLAINNVSIDGMSVDQARQILNSSAKTIRLETLCMKQKQNEPVVDLEPVAKDPIECNMKSFQSDSLPTVRRGLKQYSSRSSLTSQRRPNAQDRTVMPASRLIESGYATLRSMSYKRGTLAGVRQASFDDTRSMLSACSNLSQCNLGSVLSKTECMSVVLVTDDNDHGFEVQDGLNNSTDIGCVVISGILSGKAAERSGVLQVGDRIISINGIRTDYMPFEEFQRIMFESVTSLRLEVEFDITDAIIPSSGTFTVKIPRSENTGIVLAETNGEDSERLHRVVDIKKGSVAYRLGILAPGDQIVHINGVGIDSLSLFDANEMVRKCHDIMRVTVKKDEEIQGNTFAVEFDRRGKQLGITVSGSEDPFTPIYITSISDEGVAGRSGAVSIGDRLLAINEETLRGKPLWRAYSMLRAPSDLVKLLIKRTPSQIGTTGQKENISDQGSVSEIAPIAKDVQQWVLNTSKESMSYIQTQEKCQSSNHSGSTESYCDISDVADTQSTISDHIQTRPKKKVGSVARRPLLPTWQRECMKNYDVDSRADEFSKSDNFSHYMRNNSLSKSRTYSDTIATKPTTSRRPQNIRDGRLNNSSRTIKEDDTFSWKEALSSHPKDYVVHNDGGKNFVNSRLNRIEVDHVSRTRDVTTSNYSCVDERTRGTRFQSNGVSDGRRGERYKGMSKSNQGSRWVSNKRGGNQCDNTADSVTTARSSSSSLALSPFQFELPSKSERYLRDLERKTEAQYNDIMEKLDKSSSDGLDDVNDVDRSAGNSFATPIRFRKIVASATRVENTSAAAEAVLTNDQRGEQVVNLIAGQVKDNDAENDEDEDLLPTTVHRILITKDASDEDFGFSVSEKIDGSGIFVNSIQASGKRATGTHESIPVCAKSHYDLVYKVNGIKTRGLSCDQVVPLLQRAGRRLQLVVERVNKE